MTDSEAQVARLIVDSSAFEMFPVRDPFTPQVPQEEIRPPEPKIVAPVEVPEPVTVRPPPMPEPPAPPAPVARDIPGRPIEVPAAPLPSLEIGGLVWNTDHPQAIVNGKIVSIGDIISETRIIDIQKSGITVFFQGRTETIEMGH